MRAVKYEATVCDIWEEKGKPLLDGVTEIRVVKK